MDDITLKFNEIEWSCPADGVRHKEFIVQDNKLRLVEFSEGFVEDGWCEKGHMGYIIEGKMSVSFDDKELEFVAGDGVFIPEGEPTRHKAMVRKGEKALVFLIEKI